MINNIIYDEFSDFDEICNQITKGLFTSYAIKEGQGGRIAMFDNNIIRFLMHHASADNIVKYYLRTLGTEKEIKIQENSSFISMASNLLSNSNYALKNSNIEPGNYVFEKKLEMITNNVLVLASVFEMTEVEIDHLADDLVLSLNKMRLVSPYNIKHLRSFVGRKGMKFKIETLRKYFHLTIQNPNYHDTELLSLLSEICRKYKVDITLDDAVIQEAIDYFIQICPKCKHEHEKEILPELFALCTRTGRIKLVDALTKYLQNSFHSGLCHSSIIYEVLKPELFIENMIQDVRIAAKRKNKYNRALDELLNIKFKFDLNLDTELIKEFEGYNDYYKWLLNPKEFNYLFFDPEWLLHHPTSIYLKKLSEVQQVKSSLVNYLKVNRNPPLLNIFLNYLA